MSFQCGAVRPPPAWMAQQIGGFSWWQTQFLPAANAALVEGGGAPSSWHRTPAENRCAGGHDASQHLVGLAVDVDGDVVRMTRAWRSAGFRVVPYQRHIHAQVLPAGALERSGLLRAWGLSP